MKTFESAAADAPTAPDRLLVGVSDYVVAEDGETLVAYGLGACVAVALYDPEAGVGALAHTMLPHQPAEGGSPGKYADEAVRTMLRELVARGGDYEAAEAWLVGGAEIFALPDIADGAGERNVAAAREQLAALDVALAGMAVGGSRGRTVEFDTATGEVRVSTADGHEEVL
ncbi:chemotaxis protein CheD [Halomarina litorea]|uniref:chemotaxis protein CheD n=1 Tax=Halomarina litorea TaxID=2961595 RepID=UPI0020C4E188|nr:chemotaxis protein CheD [Halomarina sp. BCD28]